MLRRGGGVVDLIPRIVSKRIKNYDASTNETTDNNDHISVDQSLELLSSHYNTTDYNNNGKTGSSNWLVVHLHVDVCDAMGGMLICSRQKKIFKIPN